MQNIILDWNKSHHSAKCEFGVYSILANGKIVLTNHEETEIIELLTVTSPELSQNDSCGIYDQTRLEKSICQYDYLLKLISKKEISEEIILKFFESWDDPDIPEDLCFRNDDAYVSQTKYGDYTIQRNGRGYFFPNTEYYHKINSDRLIHVPHKKELNSEYKYNNLDMIKSLCQFHYLEMLKKWN